MAWLRQSCDIEFFLFFLVSFFGMFLFLSKLLLDDFKVIPCFAFGAEIHLVLKQVLDQKGAELRETERN